jgi:hypothetical protein
VGQSVIYAAASAPAGPIVSVPVSDACRDLLGLFAGVSDGRVGPGRDHPVAADMLALAAAAVVAGMKGYTAITGWVADVPPAILTDLYLRSGAAPAPPPSKTTIWRVLTDADSEAFDVAVGTWLMNLAGFTTAATASPDTGEEDCSRALMQVRRDGRAIRGARDADGNQVRLLAALAGPDAGASVVAAQAEVGVRTNEVPMATVVLGPATTWVESVRCLPPASTRASAARRVSRAPSATCSRPASATLYRTASAAARSARFSSRCSTVTSASRDGDHPGRPRSPNADANSPSSSHCPSRSRTCTASGRGRLPD